MPSELLLDGFRFELSEIIPSIFLTHIAILESENTLLSSLSFGA